MKKLLILGVLTAVVPALQAAEKEYVHKLGKEMLHITAPEVGGWRIQNEAALNKGAAQLLDHEFGGGLTGRKSFDVEKGSSGRVILKSASGILELGARGLAVTGADGSRKFQLSQPEVGPEGLTIRGRILGKQEKFYGMGERLNQVDQRGKKVDIWAHDRWCATEGNSYVPVPFLLSSSGYALLQNRFEFCTWDLDSSNKGHWILTVPEKVLDLYVFCSDDPKQSLKSLSQLTGFSPEPAEWAFGIHICRHLRSGDFSDFAGVKKVIDAMDVANLPWDSLILEGWDIRDTSTWPELRRAVELIHSRGKKALVYEPSGRLTHDHWCLKGREYYEKALGAKDSYFISMKKDGGLILPESAAENPYDASNVKSAKYVDFTNPAAVKWWRETVWGPLLKDIGIDGCKIDFCEQFPEANELVFADGRPTAGSHHRLPVEYNTMMYKMFNEFRSDGGLCLTRGGGLGAQRYPFMWTGDQLREWRYLHAMLSGTISSGLSGIPFMSYDLAGYQPARAQNKKDNIEKDVFIRGAQMASFSTMMQTHGQVTHPYQFESAVIDIYRDYCSIHNLLRPYLVECAKVASTEGVPPVRNLFLDFPKDAKAAGIEDQYMLGDDLLVAPVMHAKDSRDVYLPAGSWKCLMTGKVIEGPCELSEIAVPKTAIPVFVRQGDVSATLAPVLDEISALLSKTEGK